ncbi:MAG: hypothetical protein ACYDEF_03660 [Methanosarcina sp.]
MGIIKFMLETFVVLVAVVVAACVSFEMFGNFNYGAVAVFVSIMAWANYSDRKTKRAQLNAEAEAKK